MVLATVAIRSLAEANWYSGLVCGTGNTYRKKSYTKFGTFDVVSWYQVPLQIVDTVGTAGLVIMGG